MIQQVAGIAAQLYRSELPTQPPPQTAADLTRELRQHPELLPPVQTSADAAAQGGVQRRSGRPEGREQSPEKTITHGDEETATVTLLTDAVDRRDHPSDRGGSGSGDGSGSGTEAWYEGMGRPVVMPVRGGEVAGVYLIADVVLRARNCYSASDRLAGGYSSTGSMVDLSQ